MTDFTNFIQNNVSSSVFVCTSATDAANCQNWSNDQSMIQSSLFALTPSPCIASGGTTSIDGNSISAEFPQGTNLCSAIWDTTSAAPPDNVISLRPSDNIIATRTIWNGTNYELGRNYCNSDNAVTNSSGNIDILVNNNGSDSMKFCAALNDECNGFTFSSDCSGSQPLVQGLSTGLQTVQASSTDEVCVAFWPGNASSDAPPSSITTVQTSNLTLAGINYNWNNVLQSPITNYYTCTGDAASPSGSSSSITVKPSSVPANGQTASTVTITVVDTNGNPIPNIPISVTATNNASLTNSSPTTNSSGIATTLVTSTTTVTSTVSAVIDPQGNKVSISQTPIINFTDPGNGNGNGGTGNGNGNGGTGNGNGNGGTGIPSGSLSTITVNPNTVTADGQTASTITITVLDTNGNVIPNVPISVTATNNASVTHPLPTTNSSGVATTSVTSTTTGLSNISAVIDPQGNNVKITTTQPINFRSSNGGQPSGDTRSFWQRWWWLIVIIIVVVIIIIIIIVFASRGGKSKDTDNNNT